MSDAPLASELEPDDPDRAEPDWGRGALRELAELGMRMARLVTVGAETRAEAGEATAAELASSAMALQRAARMVRLTVALDKRLAAPPSATTTGPGRVAGRAPGRFDPADDLAEAERLEAAADAALVMRHLWLLIGKPMVRNTLALAIETEKEGPERERLLADLHERLVEREDDLIARGPGQYGDVVMSLLGELGLTGEGLDPAFALMSTAKFRAAREAAEAGRPVVAELGIRAHPPP